MRCKAGSMPTDGEAVPGVAACRRRAPFWPRNGFAASNSSAKQTGRCRGPHRGFKPAGRGVAAPETMASGGRRCARGQDVAGLLRAPGLRGSARGAPVRLEGGSGRANGYWQRVIPANPEITGVGARARFRGNSGRFFDQVARRAYGRRGGAVAVVCKTWDAVAWPVCGGAGRSARQSGVVAVC